MNKVTYLTALAAILALFVLGLGCGQGASTVSSSNEFVPQIDAPTVSSEDESVPQLIPVVPGNPIGNCCPEGFGLGTAEPGNPIDRNGDDRVCRKATAGGTITIDNNAPGECLGCIPPCDPL